MRPTLLALAAALTAFSAAAQTPPGQPNTGPISPERMSQDVKVLADKSLFGRAPGGPGEAGVIAYLTAQFKAAGLKPAGDNGTWTQAVPLIRFQVQPGAAFDFTTAGEKHELIASQDVQVWTQRPVAKVTVKAAPMVFVGYGVTAPERKWDDYKGLNLK